MKKSFLFLLLMIVGLSSLHAAQWTDAKGNTWKFDIVSSTDKAVSLTGLASGTEATVPGKVYVGDEEYVVVTIQTSAFWSNTNIVAIEDMPACTYIGVQAFYGCTSLANVGDLSACTNIERNAFQGCTSLTSVGDLSACTSIGGGAFQACSSLASIGDLPACTSIGEYAFYRCTSLTSIGDLPACTNIENNAFEACISLASIGDLYACTSIGKDAFRNCTSLASIGDLPACTSIGDAAFLGCTSLTDVGDLSACTSISIYAFYGCTSLTNIGDFSACTRISNYAFGGTSLTSIGDLPACTGIGVSAFEDCKYLVSIGDLPKCTTISDRAFYRCTSLSNISDLSACTYIGVQAFYGCTSLANVGDLSACTNIDGSAFEACISLASIGDLSACAYIGNSAFNGCTSLASISDLPACTSIGYGAFSACPLLLGITIGENTKLSSIGAFTEYITIRVPANSVETYKAADVWKDMKDRIISKDNQNNWDITIPQVSATTSALQSTLEAGGADLASVMSLKVTGDINSYDIFVMRNKMPNLHDVDLTDANIVASDYKYYGNSYTQNDIFPSVAFYQQKNLLTAKLPKSIKEIGSGAFQSCRNLRSVTMYPGITKIGSSCFTSTRLTNVEIPEGVTTLGEFAFQSCSMKEVTFPSTLTKIERYCFYICSSLQELDLPSSLESIGEYAFSSCKGLTEIVLPSALKTIGSLAFEGCSNLRVVKATAVDPNSVKMSDNSFDNYSTKTLYVPYDEKTGWNATYEAYYWHTQWGQFNPIEKWTPEYDQIHVGGKYHQHKGRIPGKNIHANFGEKAGYHLGHEGSQHLRRGHMKHNGNSSSSIIDEGDNLTIDELVCDINVNANTWYFFCFPFDVPLKDVVAPGEYVFRLYDGNKRAEGNSGWKNLSLEDSYLKAGKGYIFQTNTAGTLTITVANPDLSAKNAKTDLATSNAENGNDANWNLIGNPYLSYYELDDVEHDAPITYWNGSTYVSVRKGDDDLAIQPFQAFFVQKGSESSVNFAADKREDYDDSKEKQAAAKVRRADQKINNERLLLNITLSDGENTDKTRVVFNDRQKMEYEVECDASKFMSSEPVPQLYTVYNTVKFAINERPMGSGEVKLGYSVSKDGSYTIGMSRMDTPVMLIDTEMGITHDFQTGEYTFDAKAGSNVGRFLLMVKEDATSIRPQTVGEASDPMYFRTDGVRTQSASKGVNIVKKGNVVRKITK